MGRADPRRAYTLLEVLVGVALAGLLVSLLVAALIFSLRVTAVGTNRSNLQASAALAVRRIERELQQTSPSEITLESGGGGGTVGLALLPVLDVGSTRELQWSTERVLFYWDRGQGTLLRKCIPLDGPRRLPAGELQAAFAAPGRVQLLTPNVADFQVSGTDVITLRLRVQRKAVSGNVAESFELKRDVALRNRF
ncbi:MAG: hypothetical protein AB1758_25750 [Candidatus Eremiobacterota bacterium]